MQKTMPVFFLTLMTLFTACGQSSTSAGGVKSMTGAELQQLKLTADWQVLDVRTADEVAEGVIPGATHFADFYAADFSAQIERLDRSKKWVVYCRSGKRSSQAAEQMVKMGFTQVYNLQGGISSWTGPLKHAKP